jgi:hypothetical protein
LLAHISTFFWSRQKCHRWERFGSEDGVIEEVAASTKFKLVQEGDGSFFSPWRKAVEIAGDFVEK